MIRYLFPVFVIGAYIAASAVDGIKYRDFLMAGYWALAAGLNIIVLLLGHR
jgi:hypothetical protein